MNTKSYVLTVLLVTAIALGLWAGVAFAQTEAPARQTGDAQETPRTLTVSGSGKFFTTPDIAYVTIGVHTEGPVAATAVAENSDQAQEVIDTLRDLGIATRDIQTTNFSIYPQQEYDSEGKPTGEIKYTVDNSVYVTVRDLSEVGDVLDQAVVAGANSISGIQFDVADKTAAQSEARKAAVQNAREKAQELAQAAGVTLGEIQSITEYTSSAPVPMYDMRAAAVAESAVPVEAGQMALTIDVNIVYLIQ